MFANQISVIASGGDVDGGLLDTGDDSAGMSLMTALDR